MRRIFRDTWNGRGGLALDELRYDPVIADAMAGPIREPATHHWPLMVSVVEVVALLCRDREPVEITTGAAGLHSLLAERAGGYHARIPADLPQVQLEYDALREGTTMVGMQDALRAMEGIGLLERSSESIVLLRPPDPGPDDVLAARDHMDGVARNPDYQLVDHRLTRMAWRVERGDGVYATRFRELSRFGRLRATVAPADPTFTDPHGLFDVGPTALPPLNQSVNALTSEVHAVRGWVSAHAAISADPAAQDPGPLPLTAYEVGALLLGAGVGANAVRRAWRATGLWLLLVERVREAADSFDTSIATLAASAAPSFGLASTGDHRSTVATLLADLERVGAVSTTRPARKTLRVTLHRPAAPDDEALLHFLRQFSQWRLSGADDAAARMGHLLELSDARLRWIRTHWVSLLEQRRMHVEVLPGRDGDGP